MKEFVEYVVKALVDYPDDVYIEETKGSNTVVLELQCCASDVGKVIGKNGKIINALRTLMISIASRHALRVSFEVLEPSRLDDMLD